MKKITSIIITLTLSNLAFAETVLSDVEGTYSNNSKIEASSQLKQSLNAGFTSTTGNTKTLNINGKYDLSYMTRGYNGEDLKVALDASAFYSKNNSLKDNEEAIINFGLEQLIYDGWQGYMGINWLYNPIFKNYDSKTSMGFGLGKELYKDATQTLVAKLGTSYNIENFANNQVTNKYTGLNEYLEYHNQLNSISKLYIKAGAMQNLDDMTNDYQATGILGVNFVVAQNISLSLEEEVAYDNTPALGFQKKDSKSIVRLGYNF